MMRGAVALAAISGAAMAASGQNLLTNGDLEIGDDPNSALGWTLVEPDTNADGEPTNSAEFVGFANNTPGGARGLWFRSFEGGLGGDEPFMVNAILSQQVAGIAGVEYTLSAFTLFEAGFTADALNLTIEFLDSSDNVLGSETLDLLTVQDSDAVFREFSVSAIADAGTANVRVIAEMVNGVLSDVDPQSAFIDDLTLVPTPGAAAVLALGGLMTARRRR